MNIYSWMGEMNAKDRAGRMLQRREMNMMGKKVKILTDRTARREER